MLKYFIIITCFVLTACVTSKVKTTGPTATDAERGARTFPGLTVAELNEGKVLYETKCNTCHVMKPLDSKDEAGWRHIVPIMAKKAKITPEEEDKVLKYVVTMSAAVTEAK